MVELCGRFRPKTREDIMNDLRGFTLIELLIVVAIISILAGIALPNFLEAQTRAKVSRAHSDLRTVATALEAYAVDYNDYPPNSIDTPDNKSFAILPKNLTTPIAFLTTLEFFDPFTSHVGKDSEEACRNYTYDKILTSSDLAVLQEDGVTPPQEAVDDPGYNPGAFRKYGMWRLVSAGPDSKSFSLAEFEDDYPLYGGDIPYDTTNGTKSFGNVFRLQNGRPFPHD